MLVLDGSSLTLPDLRPILRGEPVELSVAETSFAAVRRARELVEAHVEAGHVVYGITTGFGKLRDVAIQREDLGHLQRNLVLSHCCGVGEPMPATEVRVAQVLRLNGLVRGHSGVRPELIELLVRLFNAELVPVVPQQGSVGASGDLAPLAQMCAAYMGVGEAYLKGERMPARRALERIGERPLELQAKEGLALINGTEIMKATGADVWLRAANLSKAADAIAALTIEALHASVKPFDDRFAVLKGHRGHRRVAANVRRCLVDSEVLLSHANCGAVQDPYSLRCVPQVHGAVWDTLDHLRRVLAIELNSATDNPLVFPEGGIADESTLATGGGRVISGGNFHGEPIALALDFAKIALAELGSISERRTALLVDPRLNGGLPAFLAASSGIDSGMMIYQYTAAALTSENKVLAHPASVDSIPTSANQEDHVSMGSISARHARSVVEHVERILAIELLVAAQALDLRLALSEAARPGAGVAEALARIRAEIPHLDGDREPGPDLAAATGMVRDGRLVDLVGEG